MLVWRSWCLAPQLCLTPLLISWYWNTWNPWSNVTRSFNKRPLENPNTCNSLQDTASVVMCDFEFHSPFILLHLVLLSGLEAIPKILGVRELSHFYKESYCCVYRLVCSYVLFKISSLITQRTISSGSHCIKLITWLKSDDGYQPISGVWFEIRRLLLFHGITKGQETSMENKRIRFTETSDGETKYWLTIQH